MRKALAATFVFVAVLAVSQDRVTVVVPSTPVPKGPRWQKGTVEGRSYKNPVLGIEFTPPPRFEFGAPELKGNLGTVPLLVTINALGPATLFSRREVFSFYSDALAYYPANRRTTNDYVRRVMFASAKDGFAPLQNTSENKLGGVTFVRQDFQKGPVYEAVLVKACEAQALVFIFAGSGRDFVNRLIAGTELKLDLAISGCGPPPEKEKH